MTPNGIAKESFDAVKACLLIEDDDEALPCLQELIKNWPPEDTCKPSMVLLTRDGCVPCEEEHQHHAAAIEAGIIEVVDINTPRGVEIAKKNGIDWTPAVLVLDCTDMLIEEGQTEASESAPASIV